MCKNKTTLNKKGSEYMKELESYKQILTEAGHTLPEGILNNGEHYLSKLYIARELIKLEYEVEAYEIMRGMYEINEIRFDKTLYASYEDYIEEKVKFFVELAKLSYIVTEKPEQSIPYLDEALIMLDSQESAYPYISETAIKNLRRDYINLVG